MISVALVVPAAADLTSYTTSTVQQLSLPASLNVNQTQSNTYIRIFEEQQGVALTTALAVDTLGAAGTYDSATDLVAGSVDAGTLVNSYLIHVDPIDYPGGLRAYSGSITFGDPIRGLIITRSGLEATDYSLGGASDTTYWWTGGNVANRGLEWGGQDLFTISGNTLTLNLKAAEAIDNIRVIEAVPVPAAVLLGMLGLGAAGLKLRKYV
jgi:hypothetical protein